MSCQVDSLSPGGMSTHVSPPPNPDANILSHTTLLSLTLQLIPSDTRHALSTLAKRNDSIAAFLPSNNWFNIPVTIDQNMRVSSFSMKHGHALYPLSVRVFHDVCIPREDESEFDRRAELDGGLQWLTETLNTNSNYQVIGLDAESDCKITSDGEVRLLQLSTGSRCLLIRIPSQETIRTYVEQQKQIGKMPQLFTPFFHQLMKNRTVYKSGAELWTDALDLWYYCPGVEVNSCLNMSWIFRTQRGGAMSLAQIVNISLKTQDGFIKDKATTTSSWGAPELSIRQLIYAALDAQTSWVAGANQSQIPQPFHVSDMPYSWLSRAAEWKKISRSYKLELDAAMKSGAKVDPALAADQWTLDAATRYFAQVMQGEERHHPFCAELLAQAFPTHTQALCAAPAPNVENTTLYAVDPDLLLETTAVHWWFHSGMELNFDYSYAESIWYKSLHESQRFALETTDRWRLTLIVGGPGSGKSFLAACEAIRSLSRSTSVILDQLSSPAVQQAASNQRVLCVCQSETAGRVLAAAIAEFLPPNRLAFVASQRFRDSWHPSQFPKLRNGGYIAGTHGEELGAQGEGSIPIITSDQADRDVLVCTADYILLSHFTDVMFRHRQTVIIDEANQLWLLKAILVLRKLPHTERLILFGDDRQLGAYLGHREVESVLQAAYTSGMANGVAINSFETGPKNAIPAPFRSSSQAIAVLNSQYRLKPHLLHLLNDVFYSDGLSIPPSLTDRSRVVGWVDIPGTPVKHPLDTRLGVLNQIEINAVVHLWNAFAVRKGFTLDHIAIVCMYEAQRREIADQQPEMTARCFTVEDFQGQQAEIVLLTIAAARITPSLEDVRRVNVACSRASSKLFILGDRQGLLASSTDTVWHAIDAFESLDLEDNFPELAVDKDHGFPALIGGSTSSVSVPAPMAVGGAPGSRIPSDEANSLWVKGKPAVPTPAPAPAPAKVAKSTAPTKSATPAPAASSSPAIVSPLDARLIQAVSTMLAAFGMVLLNDLNVSFKQYHKKEWSTYSQTKLDEFVQTFAEHFTLKSNPKDLRNPFVSALETLSAVPTPLPATKSTPQPASPAASAPQSKQKFVSVPVDTPPPTDWETNLGTDVTPQTTSLTTAGATSSTSSTATVSDNYGERRKQRAAEKKQRLATEKAAREAARAAEEAGKAVEQAARDAEAKEKKERERREKAVAKLAKVAANAPAAIAPSSQPASLEEVEDSSFQDVSSRHAFKHPTNLAAAMAAAMAAEIAPAQQTKHLTCGFCRVAIPMDADSCPKCDIDIDQGRNPLGEPENASSSSSAKPKPAQSPSSDERERSWSTSASSSAPSKSVESKQEGTDDIVSPYPDDMSTDQYLSATELSELSKNAKKKLPWLCSSCLGPNPNSRTTCELCDAKKPQINFLRFQRPQEIAHLPKSFWTNGTPSIEIKYESEWVKIAYTAQRGYHLVTKVPVTAGTIVLVDQCFVSVDHISSHRTKLNDDDYFPDQQIVADLAKQISQDPVQIALMAKQYPNEIDPFKIIGAQLQPPSGVKNNASAGWNWLLNVMKRPKDVSTQAWQHSIINAFTANYQPVSHPRYQTCMCKFCRFKLVRQAALLESCCWPNCATVNGVTGIPEKSRAIITICDLDAGSVLTDVSPHFGMWEWIFLPRHYRTSDLQEADVDYPRCKCPRCQGHIDPATGSSKIGGEADSLLTSMCEEDAEEDSDLIDAYDELMNSFNEVDEKFSVYELEQLENRVDEDKKKRKAAEKSQGKNNNKEPSEAKDEDSDSSDDESGGSSSSSKKSKSSSQLDDDNCFIAATDTWSEAFEFLTLWPLHRCHWRIQDVRSHLFRMERKLNLLSDVKYWMEWLPKDAKQDKLIEAEIEAEDRYSAAMTQMLHILDDAIRANKIYFRPIDPIKSIAFQRLEEFGLFLMKTNRIVGPDIFELGLDGNLQKNRNEDDEFQIPTLTFPGIGTHSGQEKYIAHLLNEVDPVASKVLRQLGWPKRERFGKRTHVNKVAAEIMKR